MLIPEIATGAAGDLAALRHALRDCVQWVVAQQPVGVLVPEDASDSDDWSLQGFGLSIGAGPAVGLAEGIARWALHGTPARVVGPAADLRPFGGLLVMGDGSASRTDSAPGHRDPRAQGFDEAVLSALASGDARALASLDQGVAADLMAAGAPAWAALGRAVGQVDAAAVDHTSDPYGVLYVVARWTVRWATPA